MSSLRKGKLVVVSGPSGVGKTTIVTRLLERPGIARSISATTRAPRGAEQDGKDYYFYPRDRFEKEVKEGGFLEWAEIVGNLYGTPAAPAAKLVDEGKIVLLAIDVQGFDTMKKQGRDFLSVFLMPPSEEELRKRIEGRGDTKDVERRLKLAKEEMAQKDRYDVVVVNRTVEQSVRDIESELKRRNLL